MNSKKKIREFVLLEKSTPRKKKKKVQLSELKRLSNEIETFWNFERFIIICTILGSYNSNINLFSEAFPYFQKHFPICQENMEGYTKFSFFSNNYSIWLDSLTAMWMSWQPNHKLKSRKWHRCLVPLPGLTSWHLALSYHEVTVTESESLSTEQLFLERKFCENYIFTGELVGDALENKKIVLKEQQKEKQFDGL